MSEVVKKISDAASRLMGMPATGAGTKYFQTNKKGEVFELKSELNSKSATKRKEAVKKVIAAMTIGKDVSSLFPEVLKCVVTQDLELKKLAYLYLMNYAHCHPDMVILAVNTFNKDAQDPNPIIRALAIRTMGCLQTDRILDYLCDPLKHALNDSSAYVRKTAALCVPKLWDLSPTVVEEFGFVEDLNEMLKDSSPSVVTNAVCALGELEQKSHGRVKLLIDSNTLFQLLSALNDCTEWGQVWILDALSKYVACTEDEALHILIHVCPRLNHANAAVIMSSVRVMLQNVPRVDSEHEQFYLRRVVAPLLSLLSSNCPKEIQFSTLRSIRCIIEKFGWLFEDGYANFFCRFGDALYVRREKMEILYLLCTPDNALKILTEFVEYCNEANVETNLLAIQYVSKIAVKITNAFEECVLFLEELFSKSNSPVFKGNCLVCLVRCLRSHPEWDSREICSKILHAEDLEDFINFTDSEISLAFLWTCKRWISWGLKIKNEAFIFQSLDEFSVFPVEVQAALLEVMILIHIKYTEPNGKLAALLLVQELLNNDFSSLSFKQTCNFWLFLLKNYPIAGILSLFAMSKEPIVLDNVFASCGRYLNELGMLSSVVHCDFAAEGDSERSAAQAVEKPAKVQEPLIHDLLDLDLTVNSPQANGYGIEGRRIQNLIDFMSEDFDLSQSGDCISLSLLDESNFTLSCMISRKDSRLSICLISTGDVPMTGKLRLLSNSLSLGLSKELDCVELFFGGKGSEKSFEFKISNSFLAHDSLLNFNSIPFELEVSPIPNESDSINDNSNTANYSGSIDIPVELLLEPLDKIEGVLFPFKQQLDHFPSPSQLLHSGIFGEDVACPGQYVAWIPWLSLHVVIQYSCGEPDSIPQSPIPSGATVMSEDERLLTLACAHLSKLCL